jgi:hypothetical protein
VTHRERRGIPALVDELAAAELQLSTCAVLRLLGVIAAPLCVALVVDAIWATALCWTAMALLYYPLLRRWGYMSLAIILGITPVYAYCELGTPPYWLAFVAAFMGFIATVYVVERLRAIRIIRQEMVGGAEASKRRDSRQRACWSRGGRH